jgi:VanZ family protein
MPVLAWLSLIYYFSTDMFSSAETAHFIIPVLNAIFPRVSLDELLVWHSVIRKLAHVTEYSILAFLTYRALKQAPNKRVTLFTVSFLFVLFAAITDEFHQFLTWSRGASVFDVGYHCFGGLLALFLINLRRR